MQRKKSFVRTRRTGVLLFLFTLFLVPAVSAFDTIPGSKGGEWIWKDVRLAGVPDSPANHDGREPPKEGPCLPLHTIEGNSGHFSVMSAYLANPAPEGRIFGHPSVGFINVDLNHGKTLRAFTLTETLFDRVEIGYAYDNLDVGDFYEDVGNVLGVRPAGHQVRLHNFNLRYQIFHENSGGRTWVPAVTAGIHYKYNEDFKDLDRDLGYALKPVLGLEDNKGLDYTLFCSKMLTFLPRPVVVTAGLRSTEAAHIGLLGFTGERKIVGEGALCLLMSEKFVFAAEYRQKPSDHKRIPGLVDREDDWWVLALAYLPTNDLSVAAGYGHFGHLANHSANRGFGVAIKYEF